MSLPRLNVFQRVILQWERLHPYNAAQAMRLTFSPGLADLTESWRTTIARLGLGPVRVEADRVIHAYSPTAIERSKVRVVPPDVTLASHLSAELNQQFEAGELPFRPFVSGGDTLGVVYHHWVCDSVCIRQILRHWLNRLTDPSGPPPAAMLPARRGYWHHFGPEASGWPVLPTILQQMTQAARMRRCRRLKTAGGSMDVRFHDHHAPLGLIDAVRQCAKLRGVKVNDLFLAALARVAAGFEGLEHPGRRKDLALGTIADLRGLSGRPVGDAFGLFLGFQNTFVGRRALADTDRLIRTIAAQSDQARRYHLAQASQIRMAMALLAGYRFDDPDLSEFYRKRMPLAAGISNVTLNPGWARERHPQIIAEFMRISPTGPFMPAVVTPTTLGQQLHVGVTTRNSAFTDATHAATVGSEFLNELAQLV